MFLYSCTLYFKCVHCQCFLSLCVMNSNDSYITHPGRLSIVREASMHVVILGGKVVTVSRIKLNQMFFNNFSAILVRTEALSPDRTIQYALLLLLHGKQGITSFGASAHNEEGTDRNDFFCEKSQSPNQSNKAKIIANACLFCVGQSESENYQKPIEISPRKACGGNVPRIL